jgi:hypothetical protein
MSEAVTITISGTKSNMPRWSTIRYNINGKNPDAIIIRTKNVGGNSSAQMYPYEEVDCGRLGRIVWFFCLKLCVYLKLI